jgi:hypothetical protein
LSNVAPFIIAFLVFKCQNWFLKLKAKTGVLSFFKVHIKQLNVKHKVYLIISIG